MKFEWLPVPLPQEFTLKVPDSIGVASETVKVTRSASLGLMIEADANGDLKYEVKAVPGTPVTGETLQLAFPHGEISGYKRLHSRTNTKGGQKHSYVRGKAETLSVSYRPDAECDTITEWLSNVPSRLWERSTERRKMAQAQRQREGVVLEDKNESEGG